MGMPQPLRIAILALAAWHVAPALAQDTGAGAGAGPASGDGLALRSVTVDGSQRPYDLHIPAHVARPAALVLVFHGGGGRPQGIAAKTGWNALADQNGFVVAYPQGAPAPSGRGGTWNVGGSFSRSDADDIGYVAAILHDVAGETPVDQARIYAAGHSMGGVFAYRLACTMSGTLAAIAPVSATMVEPHCAPTSPVAVFHTHGSDDERIPLGGGRGPETALARDWPAPRTGVLAWSRLDGCSGAPTRSTQGTASCESFGQCRAAVEMCVLAGGRHAWPAGVTDRIWAFFAAHPKGAR